VAPRTAAVKTGHRLSPQAARSGLDGDDHDLMLRPVWGIADRAAASENLLPHHHRQADPPMLLASAQTTVRRLFSASKHPSYGSCLALLLSKTAIDQEPAPIAVAGFGDRPQPDLTAGAVLARHRSERGGEVTPASWLFFAPRKSSSSGHFAEFGLARRIIKHVVGQLECRVVPTLRPNRSGASPSSAARQGRRRCGSSRRTIWRFLIGSRQDTQFRSWRIARRRQLHDLASRLPRMRGTQNPQRAVRDDQPERSAE
jgi:hypothetical protein